MDNAAYYINDEIEERNLLRFYHLFCITASFQGRIAYLLMSFHAVNPRIFGSLFNYDPSRIFFANMIYGVGVMIYWRPTMTGLAKIHRLSFSILGSLMFNHSSMLVYNWLVERLSHRSYLLTFLGFFSGRIMMIHLLAYLYHVDRLRGFRARAFNEFEAMYR